MDALCDLVLLSWNHLEQTQPCLESLFETTGVPSRLLIVDNGSEPDVRAFLATIKPRGAIGEVVLLQNDQNEGFPRGMNRGIQASASPYVCLLNNDLRFTTGWLEELLHVAESNPQVGVVNPTSNNFGNRPARGASLEEHARTLRSRHGRFTEVGMCIGFCMLIRREVINRIGGLTEEVERIFFEDEDYSMRAQEAGYFCVVAEGAYVFHAEHQTLRPSPEREAVFQRNQRWCNDRWGRRVRLAWPVFEPLVPGSAKLRSRLEQFLGWARRRTYVYVYCAMPDGLTREAMFASVGMVPHVDIVWRRIPGRLAPWAACGYILKRRKKPFDLIVSPSARWGAVMSRLGWLHRAEVVSADDEAGLTQAWKQRSRPPFCDCRI